MIMELVSPKVIILSAMFGEVAKLPWEHPKGAGAGGECFAPYSKVYMNRIQQI